MYCAVSGRAYLAALPEDESRALREETERVAQYTMTYLGETDARKVQRLCV